MNIIERSYVFNYGTNKRSLPLEERNQIMGGLIFRFILQGHCFIISLLIQHTFEDVPLIKRRCKTSKNKPDNIHVPSVGTLTLIYFNCNGNSWGRMGVEANSIVKFQNGKPFMPNGGMSSRWCGDGLVHEFIHTCSLGKDGTSPNYTNHCIVQL